MSPLEEPLTAFERNVRTVLEEGVQRTDARTRSRLNQARQAALAATLAPRRTLWRSFMLMPAAGAAAAALLVAFTLWHRQPAGELPVLESQHAMTEDVELLADSEALELVEGGDGSFYEWAVAQSDNGASDS